jgi:hypothetical protein
VRNCRLKPAFRPQWNAGFSRQPRSAHPHLITPPPQRRVSVETERANWIRSAAMEGSRGQGGTAIELGIGTPSVGRPLPARNERGEGWGGGKSNKNAAPLPGPLLLLRRKRGRRARLIPLTQCQWAGGLCYPKTNFRTRSKKCLDAPKYFCYRSQHDAAIIVLLRARRAATEGAAAFQAGVHNPDGRRRRNLETASERENLHLCSPMFAYVRLCSLMFA